MSNETGPFASPLRGGEEAKFLGWNLEADELILLHPHWQSFQARNPKKKSL